MGKNKELIGSAGFFRLMLVVLVLILAVGCGSKQTGPSTKKHRLAPQPGAAAQPQSQSPVSELLPLSAPETENPEVSAATRDPFRSFIEVKPKAGPEEKSNQALTPLQRYSLDQLKLVGVVDATNGRKGLIEDDAGKGYTIGIGDLVGNQGGQIISIEADRILVEETYQDALGTTKARRITKKLNPTDEENL